MSSMTSNNLDGSSGTPAYDSLKEHSRITQASKSKMSEDRPAKLN